MNTHVVRPAGAGHETLYVLLLCLLILSIAGAVVAWRHESLTETPVAAHQVDARRDMNAAEQGIYADLRVTLDEIRLLREDANALPEPSELAADGFAPFAVDASSVSRGGHVWQLLGDQAYLGVSPHPEVAGSFLLRIGTEPDVWLNRNSTLSVPADLSDAALIQSGWQQVTAHFDAGVTRQHRH